MPQRVTVILGDKLLSKLRNFQTKKQRDTHAIVSFSSVLNEILEAGLKKK